MQATWRSAYKTAGERITEADSAVREKMRAIDVVNHAAVTADVVGVEHQRDDLSDRKVDDRDVHHDRRHVTLTRALHRAASTCSRRF